MSLPVCSVLLLTISLTAVGCNPTTSRSPVHTDTPKVSKVKLVPNQTITLAQYTLNVQIAQTSAEQQQGLSDIENIQPNEGMLFLFSPATKPVFWMKDMRFPIDIIWIQNGQVIGIDKNLQPPTPTQTDATLIRYPAPGNITAALEVQAGWATAHTIHIGDPTSGF